MDNHMDPHFFDLINREIDGDISPAESDELRSIAAANPDSKRQLDTLRNLVLDVESIPEVAPPPGLRDEILASIRARQPQVQPPEAPRSRGPEDLVGRLAAFRRAPMIRYALAIAAGFVFGFVLYPIVGGLNRGTRFDTRDVAGTMAPLATTHPAETTDAASALAIEAIPATVSLTSTSASATVEIELPGTSSGPLMVTWRSDRFSLESFDRRSGAATVTLGASRAEISAAGAARLELRLRRLQSGSSPVRIERNAAGNGVEVMEAR